LLCAIRYKIIAERRALDFASLANDSDVSSGAASKSLDTDVSSNKTDSTQAPNSRIFCLYDVEKLEFKSVVSTFKFNSFVHFTCLLLCYLLEICRR